MPELPEVETIRRQLNRAVRGKRIEKIDVRFSGRINMSVAGFRKQLEGRTIESVGRRAKILILHLSGGVSVVTHLKMSGKLLLVEPDHKPGKHTHIVFRLSDGQVLFFDDMRKFGYMKVVDTAELEEKIFKPAGLGIEPMTEQFTVDAFAECLRRHPRATLKPLLLSQKCVVGVGNIYADESLWKAKIRPDRKAGELSDGEIRKLHDAIKSILAKSIEVGGTSFDQYRDTAGGRGGFVKLLKVYGRDGQQCAGCKAVIKKMRLGGRGTHFCAGCQG